MIDDQAHNSEGEKVPTSDISPSAYLESTLETFGIAHLLGMKIVRSQDGIGQVSIQVNKHLMHPQQIVHGGVIFTLADTAMSMALLSLLPPGTPFGTIEAKINYLRPVREGELLAEGRVVYEGGSTAAMEATVYNISADDKRAIAQVLGTFYIRRQKRAVNN
jgi:acyl-CoA thioesterase